MVEPCGLERADIRCRAEVRGPEARALLVRERDDLDRARGLRPARREPLDDRDGCDDPQRAVERPGIRNRVEVRAEDEGALAAAVAADDVADGVATGRHARVLHPACDDLSRLRECLRRDPARQAIGFLADLAEHRAAGQDVGGGARHDA
jgi:hypothetical protein